MESLGIDLKSLIGQIINFSILLIILRVFLYKPLLKMLDERREKIAKSLENAKSIDEKLAKTEQESKQILEVAHKEASQIIEQSRKIAVDQRNEMIEATKTQADRIIKAAKDESELAKKQIVEEARKEIGSVLTLALDKIVANELTEEQKAKLAEKAIKEL